MDHAIILESEIECCISRNLFNYVALTVSYCTCALPIGYLNFGCS